MTIADNAVYNMDALELLAGLPDASVDLIATDLPYNTTACEWETEIDFPAWWAAVKRVLKPSGVVFSTGSQPFTSLLVCSNLAWFRHEWIWNKTRASGYLNANRAPMKAHENIIIFAAAGGAYEPQMESGKPYRATNGAVGGYVRDKTVGGYLTENDGSRYPKTVLKFPSESGLHPTQKPVALYEYLIRTYTQPGDLVVDPFAGSGTTLVAARNLGRRYIGSDTDAGYCEIARQRLALPFTVPMFD